MENLQTSLGPNGSLHIEGFPEAVRLIKVEGNKARRLSHLTLHMSDLILAKASINAMDGLSDDLVLESLWRSAIIHVTKCFTDGSARTYKLVVNKVIKGENARKFFQYILDLRNKHIVHDINAYTMEAVGGVVNGPDSARKIERIICLNAFAQTREPYNLQNMRLLISDVIKYIEREIDTLSEDMRAELDMLDYNKLIAREQVIITVPTLDQIATKRSPIS